MTGPRVAFLGPSGTFTEEALRASAGAEVEDVPQPSVYEAVMAVQNGDTPYAVVPIENSLEGSVTATLDALAGEASGVSIAAEVVHPIRHCLLVRPGVELRQVTRVLSHPQALGQCLRYLRAALPQAERTSAPSTADAARTVAGSGEPWAAVGSGLAAWLYGCAVADEGIEDRAGNLTRFVWLARTGDALPWSLDPSAPRRTSIVFWGFNDTAPGALVAVLRELSDRGLNLTKIESRPRGEELGHYMFFADVEGGVETEPLPSALDALTGRVEELRVLGSYPVAGPPAAG